MDYKNNDKAVNKTYQLLVDKAYTPETVDSGLILIRVKNDQKLIFTSSLPDFQQLNRWCEASTVCD